MTVKFTFQPSNRRKGARVLCFFNHYFGSSSSFAGKSTSGDRPTRQAVVLKAYEAIRALRFDVTVAVCGFRDQSLLPVDIDLTSINDPTLIVYESLARMFSAHEQFDYYLNIEDDILISGDTLEAMIDFNRSSKVHEIYLPNRIEHDASETYCVDLLLMPGWRGLHRQFNGVHLDVANNPHSGLLLLSRAQLGYARERLDPEFRGPVIGGNMASAYAYAHSPFLLWRAKSDLLAHHVVHLDNWKSWPEDQASPCTPVCTALAAPRTPMGALGVKGYVDTVRAGGIICTLTGWACSGGGLPIDLQSIRLGDHEVPTFRFTRNQRPDVVAVHPDTDLNCGFEIRFSLLGLPTDAILANEVHLAWKKDGDASVLELEPAPWPGKMMNEAVLRAPCIPDQPFMPIEGKERLVALLGVAEGYLEYGTGGSTVLANRLGVPCILGVESDESWLSAVRYKLSELGSNSHTNLIHADIGTTGDWGYPTSESGWKNYPQYPLAPWTLGPGFANRIDVVLIDGRFRRACFLACLLHAKPGARILFDDYFDRPHYAGVENFVQVQARHDRVAEFVVPHDPDRQEIWLEFVHAVADAR